MNYTRIWAFNNNLAEKGLKKTKKRQQTTGRGVIQGRGPLNFAI
jgi:hypothetical protein